VSDVSEQIREIQLRVLEDMKERRDRLDKGITSLEYAIDNPTPPININFEAIREEARRGIEFLSQCERRRTEQVGN